VHTIQTTLPRGIHSGSSCHRIAVLRPLTGRQEAAIGACAPDPRAISHILADRLIRIGGLEDLSARRILLMSRGDQAHLLLMLRSAVLGDDLRLTLTCPNPSCHAPIPVALSVAEMCAVSPVVVPPQLSVSTALGVALIREPTGEDDAIVEESVAAAPAALLWSRLLLRLGDRTGLAPAEWLALPASVRSAIALGLARGHRGPQCSGSAQCVACAAWQEWRIHPAALLSVELRSGAARIVDEIHALAWHYHWSEGTILDLPRQRRWRYLRLLSESTHEDKR
jgi:hypothetical protein